MIQVTPVILCGGSGSRLWPLSRTGFPKQFLCLTGNESLFQQAAQRLSCLGQDGIQVAPPFIVSGEDHRFLASEQLREVGIPLGAALLEPTGRNTAPALTLAALAATENGQDPVLVVTPADQTVADASAFTTAVQQAIVQAAEGNIVILGVTFVNAVVPAPRAVHFAVQGVLFALGALQLDDDVLDVLTAGFVCHQHGICGFDDDQVTHAHQSDQSAAGMHQGVAAVGG